MPSQSLLMELRRVYLTNFGIGTLVPRTRSSHKLAEPTDANFGFKSGTIINIAASVLVDSEVRISGAANADELRNRDTSAANGVGH